MMNKKIVLAIIGILVGGLIAIQIRSYADVTMLLNRDLSTNDAFAQIYVLETANESLKSDILALEEQLAQYEDQASAYDTLIAEIEKNEILLGNKPISGPGVELTVNAELSQEWIIDIVNQMWVAGAEAVSVNDHRLTNVIGGFYKINELLLLDGVIIEAPYHIRAIGDHEVLRNVLNQPGGILARLNDEFQEENVELAISSKITMEAVE